MVSRLKRAVGEKDLEQQRAMKRKNNLYQQICSLENLQLADQIARKGKLQQPAVIEHDKNRDANLLALQEMLVNKTYKTSPYTTFIIKEPKERLIFRLPYFPDRIAQHAAMNILKPFFLETFTADTYSCIEGKGIRAATFDLRKALLDVPGTRYCLKMDIRKFYPSVDHAILKMLLRKKFKDKDLLSFLDEIIDSADGLPIGNYLSQYLANFYLSYFDHWIKEVLGVKYYFRYADDIIIPAATKEYLHQLLYDIRNYLRIELKLEVKDNYQIFPVSARGIDFVGYPTFHNGEVYMRKSIKQAFARAVFNCAPKSTIDSYKGWAKHCNSKHLVKKLLHEKL